MLQTWTMHKEFLPHTKVWWLSKGKILAQLFKPWVKLTMEYHFLEKGNDKVLLFRLEYRHLFSRKQIKWVYHSKENNCRYFLPIGNVYTTMSLKASQYLKTLKVGGEINKCYFWIFYNVMCQYLENLHITNIFRRPMHNVIKSCTGRDPFKVQNRPVNFNVTDWRFHWYSFKFHVVTNSSCGMV